MKKLYYAVVIKCEDDAFLYQDCALLYDDGALIYKTGAFLRIFLYNILFIYIFI